MTQKEFELERAKIRKVRLGLLRAYTKKLQDAMQRLKPREATWSEVTGGLRMVIDQMRLEYRAAELAEITEADAPEAKPEPVEAPANPLAGLRLKIHKPDAA